MSNKQHILIVDDDAGTVDIISIILQNAGYQITTDNCGNLHFLQTGLHPDLILLDNTLGQKKGADLCLELKANEQTKDIPVIMVSAADDLKILSTNACADYFLSKPFNMQDLLSLVHTALHF